MTRPPDQRRERRFAVELRTHIRNSTPPLEVVTRDVSRGGICMICPAPIVAGTPLELALCLALGRSSFSEELVVEGRAIWCTPLGPRTFQVGAAFAPLSPATESHLDMFLRFLQQEVAPDSQARQEAASPFDVDGEDDL
ncbi:MAG: PilZ domain-containing protein [Deltaproteobacteria bacterium]|nr:PilZ domain-containing protein [Deltaproteobacteria bacterium]